MIHLMAVEWALVLTVGILRLLALHRAELSIAGQNLSVYVCVCLCVNHDGKIITVSREHW